MSSWFSSPWLRTESAGVATLAAALCFIPCRAAEQSPLDLGGKAPGPNSAETFRGTRNRPATPVLEASIQVNAAVIKGAVNPFIFGQNLEAADGAGIFTGTVRDSLRA